MNRILLLLGVAIAINPASGAVLRSQLRSTKQKLLALEQLQSANLPEELAEQLVLAEESVVIERPESITETLA